MSNQVPAQSPQEIIGGVIKSCEERFLKFDMLDFKTEALFATQQCAKNDFLARVAVSNPNSLRMAILNIAAIGISLNPALGLAYLVPRDGRVILDISYRGLITLAVDSGSVLWAKPVLVYSNDQFLFKGPSLMPQHECDPFLDTVDRGDVRGGYCVAKLTCGDLMVGTMSRQEMEKIRATSRAGKHPDGPWINWEDQMQLKTIVKRESKWWPKTSTRFAEAMRVLNEDNGEGLASLSGVQALGIGSSSVVQLPKPLERNQLTVESTEIVDSLLGRAMANGAFEAAKEIASERLSNKGELAFALQELDLAKDKYQRQIADMKRQLEEDA
jgi:recombination protein RecT